MPEHKIAVVIPCLKVSKTLPDVIAGIPDFIDHIIVIDDGCPQQSGKVAEGLKDQRVTVIYHDSNQGVGGAVISGYRKALDLGCNIVIKMDGDGQMDPSYLKDLINPIIKDDADYTKGNRFVIFNELKKMPKARFFGNNVMNFVVKAYSGYWNLMDPANGYTAISSQVLNRLNLSKISKNFFFETNMLLHLYLINAVVKDVPMPARYNGEESNFQKRKFFFQFPHRLLYGFLQRILLKYFVYDFNMASIYIMFGVPLFTWGFLFGIMQWIDSATTGIPRTPGTIMVAALPLIISVEMLLQAINIDIYNIPKKEK